MIKVMIERHIADELTDHYRRCARGMLQSAMAWPGFISGEILQNQDDPNHHILLASYQSLEHWTTWFHSPERKDMMDKLRPMMTDDEKITLLEHC